MEALFEKSLQHKEHRQWLSQLNFYQDEVKKFQNSLLLVLYKHPNSLSCIEHVEEYRKILLKKLEQIDDLRFSVMCHERALVVNPDQEQTEPEKNHETVKEEINTFVEKFEKMKRNIRGFIAHND